MCIIETTFKLPGSRERKPTCMNAIPTRTPATRTRFCSSHSSPAWTQPFSLIMLLASPGCKTSVGKRAKTKAKSNESKTEMNVTLK